MTTLQIFTKKSFQAALNQINQSDFGTTEINSIIFELRNFLNAEDLGRKFFEKLQTDLTFKGENIRLIDFENRDSNIIVFPDITIFVNGLPSAFIEVRIPDNLNGIQAEYSRIKKRFSNEKIRRFVNIT